MKRVEMISRKMGRFLKQILVGIFCAGIFSSCANQLPPDGGPPDTTPPVVLSVTPKNNTTNFSGKSILIKFDEYIERRSFIDAFRITPVPKGGFEINYSGTEVEIFFPQGLEKDITYNITINKDLRDLRGNNQIDKPISIAFSTGAKIEKGLISGRVYPEVKDVVSIFVYKLTPENEDTLNPERVPPVYISQTDREGNYAFSNLPSGKFRLLAITDADRNGLLDSKFEKFAVTYSDFEINDTLGVTDANFLIEPLLVEINSTQFYSLMTYDSLNKFGTNFKLREDNVYINPEIYIYFRNTKSSRFQLADGVKLFDSTFRDEKLIYDWKSDSLLMIRPINELKAGSEYKLEISEGEYKYEINFKTVNDNKTSKVSGKYSSVEEILFPVQVQLIFESQKIFYLQKELSDAAPEFEWDMLPFGNYQLFSFIDVNGNGRFDKGNFFPFVPGEKFIYYLPKISLKPNWNVNNLFLEY